MAVYRVTFIQYNTYEVDAVDEDDAFHTAYDEFYADMHYPCANTNYDDYDIECIEKDEDDNYEECNEN